jgi:tetratricopeptide (TPR) repeat protein
MLQRYTRHPAFAQAVMDRARLMAVMGDTGGAINELNRFRGEPQLTKSEIAPAALVRLSEIMVQQGRAVDAAAMMEKARKDYEPDLLKNPARAETVASLRLSHALALRHSGKPKEALALLEGILKDYANSPAAAEASLASIQVRQVTALTALKSARQALAQVPIDKPIDQKLLTAREDAMKQAREIADAFAKHAEKIAQNAEGSELHVRTLRDAAVTWRAVADAEIEAVARKQMSDSLEKLKARIAKDPSKSNSVPRPPQIKLANLPMQPAEKTARDFYNKALEANPDSPVCTELRLELAEMCFNRGEAEAAMQLVSAAIDRNPPLPQLEQLRIRLGNCYLLKNNADGAIEQAMLLLADTNSPIRPAAYLLKGKAHMLQKDWGQAITVLTRYQAGAEKYVNAGPVTEEGLMRLGESYMSAGSLEEARQTFQTLVQRFGASRFAGDAWLHTGVALQQQKRFDEAVNAFTQATRASSADAAAKAQYRIGLCRVEQKRWGDAVKELLIVPVTYDHAESSANSSIAAAKALVELKKPAEAKQLLQQVVQEHPNTQWAAEAQKQLAQIQ